MSTITAPQRITIIRLWSQVCKDRGWKASDRAARLSKFSEIIGRPIESTDDIERIDECTKLMKSLKAMLGTDLKAAGESDDLTINKARTIRHFIAAEQIPCLELYLADVPAYISTIVETKARWWKLDRPTRGMELQDMDAKPIFHKDREGNLKEYPSALEQLRFTLAARINSLRKKAGHTIHDMRIKAGLQCNCMPCIRARERQANPSLISPPQPAPVLVS